ncbi:right-handed parallel beta-helix repeat-containing protein [Clavibacter sp. VKM Ac-2542]|uniref:right-handed parallel beta-helix repeat-containing protein n=1 Tax=Clavibacter sp. VKM Ac-2542 TaxID=2783811 RepID=UPI00188B21D8|nr:right-handed parallel beta-helix repeat-containing protein [Clavibacter sp. VKM Ac-2542]MBF4620715.1 right-handed parallel beta-helix repeat-containing protein [Clavibacter sp. VKM Ac-2542]
MRHRTPPTRSIPTRTARHAAPASRPRPARHLIALAVAVGLAVPAALVAPQTAGAATGQDLTAGTPVFSDSFTRSATGGWGAASGTGAYSYDGVSAFRANGAQGVIDLTRAGTAASAAVPVAAPVDSETTVRVLIPRVPAEGNGVYAGVQQRVTGSSYYQSSVRVDSAGDARLSVVRVTGSTAAQSTVVGDTVVARGVVPGRVVVIQSRVSGSSAVAVDARAWVEGQAVPGWQAAAVDTSASRLASGTGTRLWSYLSKSSGPQAIAFDDVAVRPLTTPVAAPAPTPTPAPTTPAPAPGTGTGSGSGTASSDAEQGVSLGDARTGAGSAPVGSTSYAVPSDAVFVAPNGSNGGSGSKSSPYATIQKAVDAAPAGRTVVVRAGSYHESVVMPQGKALTLQSYPGEKVWLDGSRHVSSWTASGSTRYASGWTVAFDASPTYTRGKPDGTAVGWRFVDPAYPMAAHPDQVWIGQQAQKQVSSRDKLAAGTFFVDTAADRLYLGSDPGSQTVRSSDLVQALSVRGDGSTVRGIGIRRFAPSVPDLGAVVVQARNVTVENLVITDNATTGISITATGAKATALTVARNGMLGMHANYADGLRASRLLVADDNTERFNRAPVSGGVKITRSRDVDVKDSAILRNAGNGLWFDESVYDANVTGNDVMDNSGSGVAFELSATIAIVDNVVARNGEEGVWIDDTGHVDIWNNTFVANDRNIDISQGTRRASDLATAGHDPRQKLPDPTVTWVVTDIDIANNVMQGSTGNAVLAVEDHSHQRSAGQMGITTSGNVYQRDAGNRPGWAVIWSRGAGDPAVYGSVQAFSAATGNDRTALAIDGRPVVGSGFRLTDEVRRVETQVAVPLIGVVAGLIGWLTGARELGADVG